MMSKWMIVAAAAAVMTLNAAAQAQSTQPALGTPSENVTSGALRARSPGTWVSRGISEHQEWNDRAFGTRGGADLPEINPLVGRVPRAIEVAVQGLLDFFLGLVDDFQAALLANRLGQTAGG